jgi:drug/metabolite transporter (DMT)-like permease
LTTVFAIPLFQAGVKYEGASEAGILSMAEPICGVAVGKIFLKENLTLLGIAGCVFMCVGIIFVEKSNLKK